MCVYVGVRHLYPVYFAGSTGSKHQNTKRNVEKFKTKGTMRIQTLFIVERLKTGNHQMNIIRFCKEIRLQKLH